MKIKMKSMAFTQSGMFDKGQVLTDKQYSKEFMLHLVNEANAAEIIEYDTKIMPKVENKIVQPSETKVKKRKGKKKKVAIIGAGPSGLAAGNDLAIMGHDVTIFEALPMAGGMLSVGIPPYRLPWNKIEGAVSWVKELGIKLKLKSTINSLEKFDKLVDKYDAVYIAAGAHKSMALEISGEDLKGVVHGITYMKDINLGKQKKVPSRVAVVGGGFTAIDCARSSLRLGAKEVFIIYRRTLKEMPAGELEVSLAEEEAIKILYLTTPIKILGDKKSKVTALECIKNRLGEPDASGRRRPEPVQIGRAHV